MPRRFIGRLLLAVLVPVLLAVVAEGLFRLWGYRPRGSYLKRVERLEVLNNFQVGEDGIYRARRDFDWPEGEIINSEGFRSPEFDAAPPGDRRVLLIGDSYGWGHSARPLTNCFADRLNALSGVTVFNLSIPGTGPDQYAAVAQKYVPIARPDDVVVAVYLGNDINQKLAPTHLEFKDPARKRWYVTNAGIFPAVDAEGRLLPPEAAYAQAANRGVRLVNALRRTAVGTQFVIWLYNRVYHVRVPDAAARRAVNGEMVEALELIARVCRENGARLIVMLIPVHPLMENARNSYRENAMLFDGVDARLVTNLTGSDYAPFPDDHFNNAGHAKAADQLRAWLAIP